MPKTTFLCLGNKIKQKELDDMQTFRTLKFYLALPFHSKTKTKSIGVQTTKKNLRETGVNKNDLHALFGFCITKTDVEILLDKIHSCQKGHVCFPCNLLQ